MSVSTGVLTITETRVAIDGTSANPFTIIVHNESNTNNIRLGGADVTAANGLELHAHESVTLNLFAGDFIYAISTSGSHPISWMKIA
jgi:adenosine/AMP kinase